MLTSSPPIKIRSASGRWMNSDSQPRSSLYGPLPSTPGLPLEGVPDLDKGRLLRPLVVIHGKVFPDTSRKHLSWLKSSNFCLCIALQKKNFPPYNLHHYFLLFAFVQTLKKCNLFFP